LQSGSVGEENGQGRNGSSDREGGSVRLHMKKCASTSCWGLNLSVSDKVSLPKYKDHVFPLFENTTLTQSERDALTAEGIKFDEEARKLRDPGRALSGKVFVGGEYRHVGQMPAEGLEVLDRKRKGELREKKRRKKAEDAERLDRGEGLVKGKRVENRNNLTVAMKKAAVRGMMYRGKVLSNEKKWNNDGTDAVWSFEICTSGMSGKDTFTRRKVSIKRVCECTCEDYEKMMGRQSQTFVWCKHIYAIMQKVLKFNPNNSLMKQIALNKEELTKIFNRTPDLIGLN
jgi:ribosomal protein L20A (L18A)